MNLMNNAIYGMHPDKIKKTKESEQFNNNKPKINIPYIGTAVRKIGR